MSADRISGWGSRGAAFGVPATRPSALVLLVAVALAPGTGAGAAQAMPTLSATLAGGQVVGEPLTEVVTLSGGVAPTGLLSFRAYGPADSACAAQPDVWTSLDVTGNGQYTFGSAPKETGVHRYVVSYEGDAGNAPASTVCGEPGQTVTVARTQPVLATTASLSGGAIVDTARLTHVAQPSGTVTFALHGPSDDTCTQPPIATSTVPVQAVASDDGRATSAPHAATVPGTYRWIATYGGDERNLPVAGACGDPGESVTVAAPASPASLRVRVPSRGTVGEQLRATATLTAPGFAAGRMTFRVYRPGDTSCRRGAVTASTRDVFGNGDYTSDPFSPDEAGTYRVVASFDGADGSTLTTSCDDDAAVAVAPAARPRPVLERTVTVERVDGTVLVDVPGSAPRDDASASAIGFVEVRRPRAVPVGSTVDTRAGTARITSATRRRRLQSGTFRGSSFVVRQRTGDKGLVELRLRPGGNARAACAAGNGAARTSKRKRLGKGVLAKLRAKVRGKFQTHGEHSSASAHGTEWLTIERCDGTLTRVLSGVVAVHDFGQQRTLLLRAGDSHLARP